MSISRWPEGSKLPGLVGYGSSRAEQATDSGCLCRSLRMALSSCPKALTCSSGDAGRNRWNEPSQVSWGLAGSGKARLVTISLSFLLFVVWLGFGFVCFVLRHSLTM